MNANENPFSFLHNSVQGEFLSFLFHHTTVALSLFVVAACSCLAAVPTLMNYQGKLASDSGPLTGTYTMRFYLYVVETSGIPVWQEPAAGQPAQAVTVSNGLFNILLGSTVPLPESAFQGETWLQTEVNGTILSPRIHIVSVGYAMRAQTAESIPDNTVTSAKIVDATITGSDIALPITLSGNSTKESVHVENSGGAGIYAKGTGGYGVMGVSDRSSAVYGVSETGSSGEFVTVGAATVPAVKAYTAGSGPALKASAGTGLAGEFVGGVKMDALQLTTGAASGKVLTSDASGSGTWQDPKSFLAGAGLSLAGNTFSVAPGGITGAMIADSTITSADIAHQTITAGDIATGSLTGNLLSLPFAVSGSSALGTSLFSVTSSGGGQALRGENKSNGVGVTGKSGSGIGVYADSSSGDAIYANAPGGRAAYFNGDVTINGSLTRNGSTHATLPIAYGNIAADATIRSGSGNFSVVCNSTRPDYSITITGETFDQANYVVTVTPAGSSIPHSLIACYYAWGGKLNIVLLEPDRSRWTNDFSFVVFKP